ncbi:hypothetical protein [Thiolapillus sp.]
MRRRGNIWVWLIGMPIILWAIAHWGFHYYVKSQLDKAILEATPQASIRYQALDTSLSGKIDVRGVEITPVGTEQKIFIRLVHVSGPDAIAYLVQQIPALGESGPPEALDVAVKGIELDISGDNAAELDRLSERAGYTKVNGKQRDICRPEGGASFSQLQELGLEKLRADMKFGYRHIPSSQKLYADFDLDIEGMQKASLSLTLDNVPALDAQKALGVLLNNLKITYDNLPEFGEKVAEYCAQKRGLTPEQFKLLMADDYLREIEKAGIVLGPGLKRALKDYLTNWGTLLVELSPPRPVGMFALAKLPREQVAEKLGLQLAVNDSLVTDLSFRILDGISLIRRNSGAAKSQKPLPPKIEYVWEYHKVSPGRLSAYVGHKVIVKESDGRSHKGKLIEVKNGRVSIQKRLSGGKFTAHLLGSNIASAQVRVRVKVEQPKSASQQAGAEKADAGESQAAAEQRQQAGG